MQSTHIEIRAATIADWPSLWPILHAVFSQGDSWPQAADISEDEAFALWMIRPAATFVALQHDRIAGTYYLRPNQDRAGAHVCNAGYMVAGDSRRRGIGRAMCRHSLTHAAAMGFSAMQFNLVVSTNLASINLWKSMGFSIVGTLPGGFAHRAQGLVDAHVMYRTLGPDIALRQDDVP